jgi:hypothetical protein
MAGVQISVVVVVGSAVVVVTSEQSSSAKHDSPQQMPAPPLHSPNALKVVSHVTPSSAHRTHSVSPEQQDSPQKRRGSQQ